jgi:uncharacterized protein YecT (DUF1311 family)
MAQVDALAGTLANQLPGAGRSIMAGVEVHWQAFRDSWCPVAVAAGGGTLAVCQLSQGAVWVSSLQQVLNTLGPQPGTPTPDAGPTPSPPDALDTCLNNGATPAALMECIRSAAAPLLEQIDERDSALSARLGPVRAPAVLGAQNAWVAYRDSWCSVVGLASVVGVAPGSGGRDLAAGICSVRLDRERLSELNSSMT